ncbi:MAG: hypothetical protein ABJQ34_20935 [Paracoccaceae bacterium]
MSVYLGSYEQLPTQSMREGALGIEDAKWTPPALAEFPHRYFLGRKGRGDELECSCLLAQHVEWTECGPTIDFDELYFPEQCPFDDLRGFISAAQRTGKPVVLACDDLGGSPHDCTNEDYNHMVISEEMITKNNFLFADPLALFPWRVFYLISS